ncbi:hypothetical protein [Xenorhabdus koppenhoeferi]|nr:hypothetical protein [Xenorhabdus koppenhoeferi]CEE94256.1 hypothetical protein XNA1_4550011 [Xenorhabdus nematophila str. Anatoliense]
MRQAKEQQLRSYRNNVILADLSRHRMYGYVNAGTAVAVPTVILSQAF